MANLNITFQYDLNTSLQIGDTMYYLSMETPHTLTDNEYTLNTATGAFTENQSGNPTQQYGDQGNMVEMGTIVGITENNDGSSTINCVIDNLLTRPTTASYFLFGKDNRANMSTLAGYYAEVEFVNDSTEYAEIFSVGSEIVESSK